MKHKNFRGVFLEWATRREKVRQEQTHTVEPGRNIFKDGKPFISINKEGSTSPAEADRITREIAKALNRPGPLA